MTRPVTCEAASEHKKTTTSAISSGYTIGPEGPPTTSLARHPPGAIPPCAAPRASGPFLAQRRSPCIPRVAYSSAAAFREARHAVFAGNAADCHGRTNEPTDRAIVHDGASSPLQHLRNLILHTQPHARQVRVDRVSPIFLRRVNHASGRPDEAGIVERVVQAAIPIDGRRVSSAARRLPSSHRHTC